jgi:hypothetical protein
MAINDVGLFQQFIEDMGNGVHNLDTDAIKLGLIDSVQTPVATSADPRWGAGGTVNFDTNEVTQTGNYTAEGLDITATWSQTTGTGTFDATDVTTWTSNASNPDDARWGIIYNSTAAGKNCIGWVDLGSAFDMTTGDLNITWNASGIFTVS